MLLSSYVVSSKKIIDKSDVISFDIFDTLLVRPYCSPKDLFLHIEKEYQLENFYHSRIKAEKSARKKADNKETISIDDIYVEIEKKYEPFKEIELNWEYKVLSPNPEFQLIWEYAKAKNKRIIITSDMYLSSEFLTKVLSKCGFNDFEKIYVSNEIGQTKKNGNLFKKILLELNIKPQKLAHFGDNIKGDFEVPQKLGIQCLHYQQVRQQFLKKNIKAQKFIDQSPINLGKSILISLLAWRWQKKTLGLNLNNLYWEDIGYAYAAPATYSYARWIEYASNLSKLDHLLFVARDGYLLQKVFKSFNTDKKTSYIYAPRFLNLIYRLDYNPERPLQINAVFNYFSDKYEEIRNLQDFSLANRATKRHEFIQKHLNLFNKYAEIELEQYKSYLTSQINTHSNISVIDTKTIAFSSQKLIEHALDRKITGLYWSTILPSKKNEFKYLEFIPNESSQFDSKIFSYNWKFMEVLISSPEYPIKGVSSDGKPIYNPTPNQEEVILRNHVKEIEIGVNDFLKDIKQLFGHTNLFIDGRDTVEWINIFYDYPSTEDKKRISEIKQSGDMEHKKYKSLFSSTITAKEFLREPRKNLNTIEKNLWKTPIQKILLNTFKPIRIDSSQKQFLKINLFPYLQYQYFVLTIKLFTKLRLQLNIGSSKPK